LLQQAKIRAAIIQALIFQIYSKNQILALFEAILNLDRTGRRTCNQFHTQVQNYSESSFCADESQ